MIRRLYARPLDTILATWGLSLVLVQGITEIYGATQRFLDLPTVGATDVLGTPYSNYRLIIDPARLRPARRARADRPLHDRRAHDPRGDDERAARAQPRHQHRAGAAAHVHHRRRARRASPARCSGRSRASTRTSAPRSSGRASSPSSSPGRTLLGLVLSCVLLGTIGTLYARYENAVWANAVVIGRRGDHPALPAAGSRAPPLMSTAAPAPRLAGALALVGRRPADAAAARHVLPEPAHRVDPLRDRRALPRPRLGLHRDPRPRPRAVVRHGRARGRDDDDGRRPERARARRARRPRRATSRGSRSGWRVAGAVALVVGLPRSRRASRTRSTSRSSRSR